MKFDQTKMIEAMRAVIQRMHYPLDLMLVCVRWYAACRLSFRNIEEVMAERGVFVDHYTLHRWSRSKCFQCCWRCADDASYCSAIAGD